MIRLEIHKVSVVPGKNTLMLVHSSEMTPEEVELVNMKFQEWGWSAPSESSEQEGR